MVKNIIWMVSGLGLGLAIWAVYEQYKKAKAKKEEEKAEAAAAAVSAAVTTAAGTVTAPVKPTAGLVDSTNTSTIPTTAARY